MRYAADTSVPVERSKAEIEQVVSRYGATGFMSGWKDDQAMIMFEMRSRRVKFLLPLPDKNSDEFRKTPTGRIRKNVQANTQAWEQACRQRWRALGLTVKAKLEAVETGISTFEQEFLAHLVLPSGETVADQMLPRLDGILSGKPLPPLLGGPGGTEGSKHRSPD